MFHALLDFTSSPPQIGRLNTKFEDLESSRSHNFQMIITCYKKNDNNNRMVMDW